MSTGPSPDVSREHSSMTIERRHRLAFPVLAVVLGLVVGIARSALADSDSPIPAVNAKEGIGLKGYDPVAYFINGAPTQGTEQYSFVYKGVTYRFASAENLERFKADTEKYLPRYGGYSSDELAVAHHARIETSSRAIAR